ncbi:MAG: aldo/keto reductase [Candidatus Hydrogenedentes bacterium]|nr:aldo/keto reductase [Candidatus Hydrogenedentota bacterium]
MSHETDHTEMQRREFMKTTAVAVAGSAMLGASSASARPVDRDGLDHRNERNDIMTYRKLGRTNFMSSRLVFGCGAALQGGKAVRLLEEAFERGINHFDVGSNAYYKGSEKNLAPFFKKHRGEIWVTSKAPVRGAYDREAKESFSKADAQTAADRWSQLLDASLTDLDTDYVDAYYLMMIDQPALMKTDEILNAFARAQELGKVGHFGISSHRRAEVCLEAAIELGTYDLAMIAVTPSGWYELSKRGPVEDAPDLKNLRPLLDRARDAGIGLVGMKAGRFMAPTRAGGKNDNIAAFDHHYNEKLRDAPLSPFQRSYAYVLEHGLDVVNADMQNFNHFEENAIAARTSHEYFA